MERVVTAAVMREAEQKVMGGWNIPSLLLMERAAAFAADEIEKRIKTPDTAVLLCGMGNNGGDGLALARILLERGWRVHVGMVGEQSKATAENRRQQELLEQLIDSGESPESKQMLTLDKFRNSGSVDEALSGAAMYVDAMLGIGGKRALQGVFAQAAEWMNRQRGLKVSLDLPTGVDADTGVCRADENGKCCRVQADLTVTFGACKAGLMLADAKRAAGEIRADSCGIFYGRRNAADIFQKTATKQSPAGYLGYKDADGIMLLPEDVADLLKRDPGGNKGSFGKLFFWTGSPRMAGAPLMAASAAFSSGAGYIRLLSAPQNRDVILSSLPEIVFTKTGEDDRKAFAEGIRFADVVAAGCGIGIDEQAQKRFKVLLEELAAAERKPILLLDADALNLIAADQSLWEQVRKTGCETLLTPHMAEFARLTKMTVEEIREDRINIAKEFAAGKGAVLILKDSETLIVSCDGHFCINPTGNDGMAVAGSGDCLTGIIAAMAGRLKEGFFAAAAGVYLHGSAGDLAAEELGKDSMRPSDLIRHLPEAIRSLKEISRK